MFMMRAGNVGKVRGLLMSSLEPGKHWHCRDCGAILDVHDVDANVATFGYFDFLCSGCIEFNTKEA
jgi:hypothetical protein